MQHLTNIGISTQPFTRKNLDLALKLINQAYLQNPVIQKKIQTLQQLNDYNQILMNNYLITQEIANKKYKTDISYGVFYIYNDQPFSVSGYCDMQIYLEVIKKSPYDIYLQPLKYINRQKIAQQKSIYMTRSIISKQARGKKLPKWLFLQRFQFAYKNGYKACYLITSNKLVDSALKPFVTQQINGSDYKMSNGQSLRLVLYKIDLQKSLNKNKLGFQKPNL